MRLCWVVCNFANISSNQHYNVNYCGIYWQFRSQKYLFISTAVWIYFQVFKKNIFISTADRIFCKTKIKYNYFNLDKFLYRKFKINLFFTIFHASLQICDKKNFYKLLGAQINNNKI